MSQSLKLVSQTIDYTTTTNKDIAVTVIIGDSQLGASKVYFELDQDNILQKGDVVNFIIGRGNELKNKNLIIRTTVLDRNPNTNNISVTILLSENGQITSTLYEDKVDLDKDALRLTTAIKFN